MWESKGDMSVNTKAASAVARWFLVWSTVGCIFALQLYWHYELPWSLSIFWGLSDWYLWGLLALPIGKAVRHLKNLNWSARSTGVVLLLAAPAVAALHVVLTMLVGGIGGLPAGTAWLEYFQALYAKKLTLNLITYAAIVTIYARISPKKPRQDTKFLARLRDATRLVSADEIIRGEVCGNYVNLYTEDGVWPVRVTLTNLLRRLPDHQFVRISRSAMVSLKWVREQHSEAVSVQLVLANGERVKVSRRIRAQVQRAIRTSCLLDQQE